MLLRGGGGGVRTGEGGHLRVELTGAAPVVQVVAADEGEVVHQHGLGVKHAALVPENIGQGLAANKGHG